MPDEISCECAICSLKLNFDLDPHLLSEIEKHNCVIFAGAGVSTETSHTHPEKLYDTLKAEAGIETNPEFWEVVDKIESRPNGRQRFVEIVLDRFDYIDSFRDLKWAATRFHRALANAIFFPVIVTTNWDRYFEDMAGATPFVYDSDIPFWQRARRPVLKIHGSVDNYSSLVASSKDYALCEERLREGSLGAVLKQIFATKTVIFCGYTAKDKDFRQVYNIIRRGLGQFARTHYLVSPFIDDVEAEELMRDLGIYAIKTDATHFLETVKGHMQQKFCFASDEVFERVVELLEYIRELHREFVASYDVKQSPHMIFATAYQDGLLHALERILDRAKFGEFSDLHRVQAKISSYEVRIKELAKLKNYWDLSYFKGYQNGLLFFVMSSEDSDAPPPPECFHPGSGERYLDEYNEAIRDNPQIHKLALAQAKKFTARFSAESDLVIQHSPWG